MSQVVVYQPEGAPAAVVYPCTESMIALEIGQKDVPAGLPFWIIEDSELPEDRTFRSAWELDAASMGEPAGTGGTYVPKEQEGQE